MRPFRAASAAAATAVVLVLALAGCATHIKAQDETIKPSKVPLGSFQAVELAPLVVEQMEGDSGDRAAVERIDGDLRNCMRGVFPNLAEPGTAAGDGTLLIEPAIVNLKKVNTAERVFLGPLSGSSAVLLRVRFTDKTKNDVVAQPTFYARASAMSGAWTFGTTDNIMLMRIINEACSYSRQNR